MPSNQDKKGTKKCSAGFRHCQPWHWGTTWFAIFKSLVWPLLDHGWLCERGTDRHLMKRSALRSKDPLKAAESFVVRQRSTVLREDQNKDPETSSGWQCMVPFSRACFVEPKSPDPDQEYCQDDEKGSHPLSLPCNPLSLSSRSAPVRDLVFNPPAVGSLASTDVLQCIASRHVLCSLTLQIHGFIIVDAFKE